MMRGKDAFESMIKWCDWLAPANRSPPQASLCHLMTYLSRRHCRKRRQFFLFICRHYAGKVNPSADIFDFIEVLRCFTTANAATAPWLLAIVPPLTSKTQTTN